MIWFNHHALHIPLKMEYLLLYKFEVDIFYTRRSHCISNLMCLCYVCAYARFFPLQKSFEKSWLHLVKTFLLAIIEPAPKIWATSKNFSFFDQCILSWVELIIFEHAVCLSPFLPFPSSKQTKIMGAHLYISSSGSNTGASITGPLDPLSSCFCFPSILFVWCGF